jgi:Peptidase family M1 domain
VVFPQPLQAGQHLELRFVYRGEVLSEAGPGLLYVGARGTWYPNFGPAMSTFDLEFRYPVGWTLLATGQRHAPEISPAGAGRPSATSSGAAGEQVSRWISERPMPLAGFNLGQYTHATAHAGSVAVEVYATSGMERTFPKAPAAALMPALPTVVTVPRDQATIDAPPPPSPALNEQRVAEESARAVDFFAHRFGPYPYGKLALTQMPGQLSQGWPGLIFLSSFVFLSPEEKAQLHVSSLEDTRSNLVVAHETAHQWWGDLVVWKGYRDQWIIEALAEYSSLMQLESQDPAKFRAVLESYQGKLFEKNKDGMPLMEAGPVTLGIRLSCSPFPAGYQAISYGRGTWLFHMLRTMTRDAESKRTEHRASARENLDEPFLRALRKLRERYQGKSISTRDVLRVFEEELPPSLWYEGQKSLDWFYNGWINGTAIPRLELHDVKYVERDGSARISGTIRQSEAPEDLVTLVPVYGTVGGKSVLLGQVFADGSETAFHLTAPMGTRKAVLDPYRTLLARTR